MEEENNDSGINSGSEFQASSPESSESNFTTTTNPDYFTNVFMPYYGNVPQFIPKSNTAPMLFNASIPVGIGAHFMAPALQNIQRSEDAMRIEGETQIKVETGLYDSNERTSYDLLDNRLEVQEYQDMKRYENNVVGYGENRMNYQSKKDRFLENKNYQGIENFENNKSNQNKTFYQENEENYRENRKNYQENYDNKEEKCQDKTDSYQECKKNIQDLQRNIVANNNQNGHTILNGEDCQNNSNNENYSSCQNNLNEKHKEGEENRRNCQNNHNNLNYQNKKNFQSGDNYERNQDIENSPRNQSFRKQVNHNLDNDNIQNEKNLQNNSNPKINSIPKINDEENELQTYESSFIKTEIESNNTEEFKPEELSPFGGIPLERIEAYQQFLRNKFFNDTSDNPLLSLQLSLQKSGFLPPPISPNRSEHSNEGGNRSDDVKSEEEEFEEENLNIPKLNSHGKVKKHKCKQCGYVAFTKIDFWEHTKTHIREDRLLTCPKCPFVTEYKHHLEYHLRNHTGSKPFKCDKCSYSCVNKSMLNSHKKSHSKIYQYRCADCSYATKYCHSLKLHLRKYTHKPAMVLNPDGTPNPLPIIDVYGTRRGPKAKTISILQEKVAEISASQQELAQKHLLMMMQTQQLMQSQQLIQPQQLIQQQQLTQSQQLIQNSEAQGPKSQPFVLQNKNIQELVQNRKIQELIHNQKIETQPQEINPQHLLKLQEMNSQQMMNMQEMNPQQLLKIQEMNHQQLVQSQALLQSQHLMQPQQYPFPLPMLAGLQNVLCMQMQSLQQQGVRFQVPEEKEGTDATPPGLITPPHEEVLDLSQQGHNVHTPMKSLRNSEEDLTPKSYNTSPESLVIHDDVDDRSKFEHTDKSCEDKINFEEDKHKNKYKFGESNCNLSKLEDNKEEKFKEIDESKGESRFDRERNAKRNNSNNFKPGTSGIQTEMIGSKRRKGRAFRLESLDRISSSEEEDCPKIAHLDEDYENKCDSKSDGDEITNGSGSIYNNNNSSKFLNNNSVKEICEVSNKTECENLGTNAFSGVKTFAGKTSGYNFTHGNAISNPLTGNSVIGNKSNCNSTISNDVTDVNEITNQNKTLTSNDSINDKRRTSINSDDGVNETQQDFKCKYCRIGFDDVILYSMHMGYHGFKEPFTCNMCGEECVDKISFNLHIARTRHN